MKKIFYLLLLLPFVSSCQNRSGNYIVYEIDCLKKHYKGYIIDENRNSLDSGRMPCNKGALDVIRPLFLSKNFKLDFQKDYVRILDTETNQSMTLSKVSKETQAFYDRYDFPESDRNRFTNTTDFLGEKFLINLQYDEDSRIRFMIHGTFQGEELSAYCTLSKQ